MNRNVESHFAELPSVSIERSMFDRSVDHLTSFNAGELVPFFFDEVLPGDTYNVTTSFVARLQTLLTPIMSNVYLDTFYFYIPSRILWTHWKEFMGENTSSAWIPQAEYTVPKINSPKDGWITGTIADHFGIPVNVDFSAEEGTDGVAPIALPFRAYAMICDQFFRDQNVSDPLNIPLGDANQTGSNGTNYITDVVNGGMPFKVAKYHDYFTSCLPAAQKGPPVTFGANPIASGDLPVRAIYGKSINSKYFPEDVSGELHGLKLTKSDGSEINGAGGYYSLGVVGAGPSDASDGSVGFYGTSYSGAAYPVAPSNLFADGSLLSVSGVSFTINELRLAFQLQKFYEKWARAGSRYRETLKEMFGVTSPDARMMIPEYLGGHRVPIQIHQITNSSEADGANLGDLGAMSNTSDVHEDFIKSFTEHGYIIGLACVRYDHSYPQGLNKLWTRSDRMSYYFPVFANLGEMPVYRYEIDASNYQDEDRTDIFGFQEAWAEYRYMPNQVTGEMRPGILNSLASWHLADYYTQPPQLSDEWIREEKANVDRVLAVTSEVSNQVFCDFYVKNLVTRPMPMYSIPGLIDHH